MIVFPSKLFQYGQAPPLSVQDVRKQNRSLPVHPSLVRICLSSPRSVPVLPSVLLNALWLHALPIQAPHAESTAVCVPVHLRYPHGASFPQESGIVCCIRIDLSFIHFDDPVRHAVKKISVMGYHNDRAFVCAQFAL